MKLARLRTSFVHIAALALVALGSGPVGAAGPVKVQSPVAPDESPRNMNWFLRDEALFGPHVGLSDKARKKSGIGAVVAPGAEWLPRIGGLNGYAAASTGFYRGRSVNVLSRLSVTVFDRRVALSRFTVSRRRISIGIATAF